MRSKELYHEETKWRCDIAVVVSFVFPQKSVNLLSLLITIDWSWHSRYRLASNSHEISLNPFCSKEYEFLATLVFVWPSITNCSPSSDRIIGNSVLWHLLKINVKLLYMHVNFATRIAAESFAERSLSLLTMRNKAFMQQSGHCTDTLTLVKYIVHDTQLSFLRWPYSVICRQVCFYKS